MRCASSEVQIQMGRGRVAVGPPGRPCERSAIKVPFEIHDRGHHRERNSEGFSLKCEDTSHSDTPSSISHRNSHPKLLIRAHARRVSDRVKFTQSLSNLSYLPTAHGSWAGYVATHMHTTHVQASCIPLSASCLTRDALLHARNRLEKTTALLCFTRNLCCLVYGLFDRRQPGHVDASKGLVLTCLS